VDQQVGGAAAGIGFAIPSDTVRLIAPQLIATGHVTNSGRAALGIRASDAVNAQGNSVGVTVVGVVAGGAAVKAGIVAGDVIVAINGQTVSSLADLQSIMAGVTPGTRVKASVVRQDGARKTFNVEVGQLTS
jgi:putative serine protease PepD